MEASQFLSELKLRYPCDIEMKKSSFRGFEKIISLSYSQESKDCRGCENDCKYKIVTLEDGSKFYSEDLCERYSAMQKKKLGEELPDLFEEYNKLIEIFSVFSNNAEKREKTIGIPRGLMFNDLFPFFNAFFFDLGFRVQTSEKTNKRIIQLGLESVIGEPCYPIKVSHGHVAELIEKKEAEYIFVPDIVNIEDTIYPQSYTCPYIQAAPNIFRAAFSEKNIKLLSPTLYFRRDFKQFEHEFYDLFKKNNFKISKKEIRNALNFALNVQEGFYKKIEERGKEILNSLEKNQIAFVVIGRPYAIYDPAMNMHIAKKIRDLGILPIPFDFLPLKNATVEKEFTNLYARQAQKILSAARIIKNDSRLRGVIIDYFACGPNAFINQFFMEEINRK